MSDPWWLTALKQAADDSRDDLPDEEEVPYAPVLTSPFAASSAVMGKRLTREQREAIREKWRNDGADGETIHQLLDELEAEEREHKESCVIVDALALAGTQYAGDPEKQAMLVHGLMMRAVKVRTQS